MTEEKKTVDVHEDPVAQTGDAVIDENKEAVDGTVDNTPPVRKTPQDYILERYAKKNEASEKTISELQEQLKAAQASSEPIGEKEMVNESLRHVNEIQRRMEVRDFVEQNQDYKPFQDRITSWANNKAYGQIPVEQVALAAAGKEVFGKIEKSKSDAMAKDTAVVGGYAAPAPKPPKGINDMSDSEFLAYQRDVLRGQ